MASRLYNRGMFDLFTNAFASADIRVLLVSSAYTFSPDHNFVSDVVASEIATTNYARQTLANKLVTENDTDDSVVFDADNNLWTALGPATGGPIVGGAIVFRHTGSDATAPVIVFEDFADIQVNGGNFTVTWNAAGLFVATSP